ncbi:unnamed protein product, partial [Rotaria magnacalcarata]
MLLYAGYPLKYIRYHFYKTLVTLSINPSIITPIIYDENQYDLARQNYLKQPTKLQHLRASRIAGQMNPHQRPLWMDPIVSFPFDKKQQKKNTDDPMILLYIHEKRLRHYKFMIHKIWQQAFGKTPAATMRLIVGTRNNRNLIKELVRRSPYITNNNQITATPSRRMKKNLKRLTHESYRARNRTT